MIVNSNTLNSLENGEWHFSKKSFRISLIKPFSFSYQPHAPRHYFRIRKYDVYRKLENGKVEILRHKKTYPFIPVSPENLGEEIP